MTEIMKAITERRAVKRFDPAHQIADAELRAILEAGMHAPTAFNIQHWRFCVVRDPAQRARIAEVAWNQPQITECSALIVLCADFKAWKGGAARYWAGTPQAMYDKYAAMIPGFYEGDEHLQRDEGIRSCGMAAYAIMLAAAAHGLQSCPMDGFDFAQVAKVINLPEHHEVVMFVAIGKGAAPPPPRGPRLAYEDVVVENSFH